METEKVAIDVTSPAAGTLVGILYKAGDVVPVATEIAYILKPGETLPNTPTVQTQASTTTQDPASVATKSPKPSAVQASPLALRVAEELHIPIQDVPTKHQKISKEDVEAYAASLKSPEQFNCFYRQDCCYTCGKTRVKRNRGPAFIS